MTDHGRPLRPLPPADRPSPLDDLPPLVRPYAHHRATELGRERSEEARRLATGPVPPFGRFVEGALELVVAELLELPPAELERRANAYLAHQETERQDRARAARIEKAGQGPNAPDGPSSSMASLRPHSYAEILGREPTARPTERGRSSEDEADRREREAIEGAA